jgi:phosphoribosylglycinamide formyltransferase-1
VLAGFLKILSGSFIRAFPNRIINIHPSLLPCFGGKGFYGEKVHKSVIESGARISGCTVHFVTEDVDLGPIIDQESVPVLDRDTPEQLAMRIHPVEHELLVRSIRLLVSGRYEIIGKRVVRT